MMIAPSSANTTHGVQYIGFVADIVRKLSEVVGFRYELYVAPDNNYGYRKSDGTWNGMVRELLSKVRYRNEILKLTIGVRFCFRFKCLPWRCFVFPFCFSIHQLKFGLKNTNNSLT